VFNLVRLTLLTLFMMGPMHDAVAQVAANHEGGNNGFRYQCNSAAPRAAIIACTHIIEDKREDAAGRAVAFRIAGSTINRLVNSIVPSLITPRC
jgi:hypothetical protein